MQSNVGLVGSLAQTHALSSLPKDDHAQARDFYSSFNDVLDLLEGKTEKFENEYQYELISTVVSAIKG